MTGPIEGAWELPGYFNCASEKSPRDQGRALELGCGLCRLLVSTFVTEIERFPVALSIKVLRFLGFLALPFLPAISANTFGQLQITNQTLFLDMPGATYNVFLDNSNIGTVSSALLAAGVNLLGDFTGAFWGQYKETLQLLSHARETSSEPGWSAVFGEYR